mgnify:CR=1 FL=1
MALFARHPLGESTLAALSSVATTVEPAVGLRAVLVVHDGALSALSLQTGIVQWTVALSGRLSTRPVVDRERVVREQEMRREQRDLIVGIRCLHCLCRTRVVGRLAPHDFAASLLQ